MVEGELTAAGWRDAGEVGERFPFTKFLPPDLDDRVHVEGAVSRLDQATATHRLTVVAAPAGAGKTTALAAWARTADLPVVWIRMSSDDRSPPVAAAALLAGTRGIIEGFGSRMEQVLGSVAVSASPQHLVTSLVNDLGEGPAPVVILDDFHEVTEPDCLGFFDVLLDQLPPDVRVLIGTRTEPQVSLPRRRVRGEVAELGLDDLRLDGPAIRRVLGRAAEVSDELVEAVTAASGGWAAAVRLATAQLAAGSGTVGTHAASSALKRLRSDLWRFLAEEVLDRQPGGVRRFLLETSVLDELSPAVCATVTGREDSAALLAELDRHNLFVAHFADRDGEAWRYHDLFATFLRDQLRAERSTDEVAELHRRAASALPPALAVPHLLAAGEHERVAELAIELAFAHFDASTATVVAPWVEALPAEVVGRDHRLPLVLAWRDEMQGRAAEILTRLEPVHERLQGAGEEVAAAEIGLELAAAWMMLGELERVGELLEAAAAQPLQGWWPLIGVVTRMHWSRARGDWAGATAAVHAAFDLTRAAADQSLRSLLAAALSSSFLFSDRGPAWLVARTRELAARLTASNTASRTSLRRILAGGALLQLDTDWAAVELRQCLTESRELGGLAWVHQEAEGLLLALSLGIGDHATVHGVVSEALGRMGDSPIDASLRFTYAYAALRSDWLRGERTQISGTAARFLPSGDASVTSEEQIVRTLAEALAARADGRATEALGPLREAEARQHEARCWLGAGLPGLERATILFEQGRAAAAIEAVEPTLAAAAELGPGLLLPEVQVHRDLLQRCAQAGVEADMIQAVLAAAGRRAGSTAVAVPGTGETLSPREVEVLSQVALGQSNREIAGALFVSEVTVKSHLTRILRKLDATSRTHAVARARELHLL